MPFVRKLRVSNPRRRKNSRRRSRRNPGEVLIVANPRRRRRSRKSHARRSRKSNPFRMKRHSFRRRSHRRSNPGFSGVNTKDLLELSLGGAAGILGSKAAAQAVLGNNNSGWMGLGATAIAGGVIAWAAKKFVGPKAAVGVLAGTGASIALAIWQQYVSGTGTGAMSGLGDPDMAGVLGDYRTVGPIATPYMFPAAPAPVPAQTAPARRRG